MVNILGVCDSSNVIRAIYYVKIIVNIICIVVPIILILVCMINVVKVITSKDNDALTKMLGTWAKRSIAAIIIFFIPNLVNLVVKINDDDSNFKSCYESASLEKADSLKKAEDLKAEEEIKKWKEEEERKIKEKEEQARKEREEKEKENGNGNPGGSGSGGGTTVGSLAKVDLTNLGCPVTYAGSPLSSFRVDAGYANSVHSALASWCSGFVRSHSNLTTRIETAGSYVEKPGYHGRGLAIDFYNNWVYYQNGKKYTPYAGQGSTTWNNYRKFICEVCNGRENCTQNINYHLYHSYFKKIGWCWGGNWTTGYFDPMHYEKTDGGCSDASSTRISCN